MSARLTIPFHEHVRARPTRRDRPEPHPEPERPRRLVVKRRGQTFRPHGTDSVGVIRSSPKNTRSVEFSYRHDPDRIHSMRAHEFNERFAALDPLPIRRAAGKTIVRPLPAGFISTLAGKAA